MREITELLYNLSPGTVIYTEKDPVYEYIEITKYINGYYRCFTYRINESGEASDFRELLKLPQDLLGDYLI